MAARKLQTEIDRTLKKVGEGVEVFESIYDKMQASTNQTQKEKLETDLKTQIKKLQRLRDQIKSWVASNEIKDKSQLLDNRKLIETQMEKFKACEKEMKTKAFSKDGLNAAQKLDPKEREKAEMTQWVATQVEELMRQIEVTEAEIEQLQGGTTRSRRAKAAGGGGRADELTTLNERRKWHVGRLEIVLRLLENNTLQTDTVSTLKEHISYFVESNAGEDFEFDEGVYDELNLDEEEEAFGIANDDNGSDGESESVADERPSRTSAKDVKSKGHSLDDDSHSKREESSPVLKKAAARKQSIHIEPKPAPITQSTVPPAPKASQPTAPTKVTLPPIRYAAAAAAAVKHDNPASKESPKPAPSVVNPSPAQSLLGSTQTAPAPSIASNPVPPAPSIPPPASTEPPAQPSEPRSPSMASSVVSPAPPSLPLDTPPGIPPQPHSHGDSRHQSPVSSRAGVDPSIDAASVSSPYAVSSVAAPSAGVSPYISQALTAEPLPINGSSGLNNPGSNGVSSLPLPSSQSQLSSSMSVSSPLPQQVQTQGPPGFGYADSQQTHSQNVPHQQPPQQQRQLPSSLSDLVSTFEASKEKAARRDPEQISKALAAGFESMPQPQDTAKPKYYVPRNPFPSQPYYPQQPLAVLSSPALYSQLDVETLFFVFYYLPGTYMQYLAAKELKRQSWRFHVKYLTWFQRHSEPQAITDEYEQGVYVYFDWEGSWCQRKKSDFRFEYRHLSED